MSESARPETTPSIPPQIYEHVTRKDWGRAILLNEQIDRHTFLFEDGAERTVHVTHIAKMSTMHVEPNEALRVHRSAKRNQTPVVSSTRKSKLPPKKPDFTFAEQIRYFQKLFPGGFADENYIHAERGRSGQKTSQPLIEAILERAETELAREKIDILIADKDFVGVQKCIVDFLAFAKSLVQKSDTSILSTLTKEGLERFANAVYELLYGQSDFDARFDDFVQAIDAKGGASWPLATTLIAFTYPRDHVLVKPTTLKKQALVLDIEPKFSPTPNPDTYGQFVETAKKAKELLEQAGLKPRDLLDVAVFMSKTLSPKALKEIAAP